MKKINQKMLLFPTHYLGNFILGLPWVIAAIEKDPTTVVVLDARFSPFIEIALKSHKNIIEYPRDELKSKQIS